MRRVYTAESPIHGTGVFSASPFSPGEIILKIDDHRVVIDADPLDSAKGEFEHHCDYLAGGKVVLMQPPERFINHRCDPNTFTRTIAGDRYVVALTAEVGEPSARQRARASEIAQRIVRRRPRKG